MEGEEFNNYIKESKEVKKLTIKDISKILDQSSINEFINKFEGLSNQTNIFQNKLVREYVDQVLDKEVDSRFANFIIKMRDIYYKKKQLQPLKAKKRFVVGMREIEKYQRLK